MPRVPESQSFLSFWSNPLRLCDIEQVAQLHKEKIKVQARGLRSQNMVSASSSPLKAPSAVRSPSRTGRAV